MCTCLQLARSPLFGKWGGCWDRAGPSPRLGGAWGTNHGFRSGGRGPAPPGHKCMCLYTCEPSTGPSPVASLLFPGTLPAVNDPSSKKRSATRRIVPKSPRLYATYSQQQRGSSYRCRTTTRSDILPLRVCHYARHSTVPTLCLIMLLPHAPHFGKREV